MKGRSIYSIILGIGAVATSCRKRYLPKVTNTAVNLLVVVKNTRTGKDTIVGFAYSTHSCVYCTLHVSIKNRILD